MTTFVQRMEQSGGHTSGFDYLRILLALSVMSWHSAQLCYGLDIVPTIMSRWYSFGILMILPMFFSLSGFLVAGSLARVESLRIFMGLRALRILPALCVEVILSALILGPALTAFDVKTYFSSATFYSYFFNIIGYVHFDLPGLFLDNPMPRIVNNSLWTVPFELECYVTLFLLALFGIVQRPKILLGLLLVFSIGCLAYFFATGALAQPLVVTGRRLVLFFLGGVVMFAWRKKIPHHPACFLWAAILCALCIRSSSLIYLAPLPVAYVTSYLGLFSPRKIGILLGGDYSYGIYLYAFPIQQTIALLFPDTHIWYLNIAAALVPLCLFAAFSWHMVEKPVLRLKRRLVKSNKQSAPVLKAYPDG